MTLLLNIGLNYKLKKHVAKDVQPKAVYVYTVCQKAFIFIL